MRLSTAVTLSTTFNFRLFRIFSVRTCLMSADKGCASTFMQNLRIIACEFQANVFQTLQHLETYRPLFSSACLLPCVPVCSSSNRILTKFVHLN